MSCLLDAVLDCNTCEDKGLLIAGVAKSMWIGNRSEWTFTQSSNGLVTLLTPAQYAVLYPWCSRELSVSAMQEMQISASRAKYYKQSINGIAEPQAQDGKAAIDELKDATNLFVVIELLNRTFEVYGLTSGLEMETLTKSTGINRTEDNGYVMMLGHREGNGEGKQAPTFLITDYVTTLAALNALV